MLQPGCNFRTGSFCNLAVMSRSLRCSGASFAGITPTARHARSVRGGDCPVLSQLNNKPAFNPLAKGTFRAQPNPICSTVNGRVSARGLEEPSETTRPACFGITSVLNFCFLRHGDKSQQNRRELRRFGNAIMGDCETRSRKER